MLRRSAGVAIELYPSNTKGVVLMDIRNLGPVTMTEPEIRRTLRSALRTASRADSPGMDEDQIALAKLAYAAYGQQTDFKNYQGNPMPSWEDLGDRIQGAWIAAAGAVQEYLVGPPAADE